MIKQRVVRKLKSNHKPIIPHFSHISHKYHKDKQHSVKTLSTDEELFTLLSFMF
jgi:hypothetical protein